LAIWEDFKEWLSFDFYIRHGLNVALAEDLALQEYDHMLQSNNKSLESYGLPHAAEYPKRWCKRWSVGTETPNFSMLQHLKHGLPATSS
jgi:hypothetical protein